MSDCSTPKRAILAPLHANSHSPVSPMANLKLLTKVAAGFDEDNTATSYQTVQIVENAEEAIIEEEEEDDDCCSSSSNFGGGIMTSGGGCGELVTSTRRFRSLNHIFREFLALYPLHIPGDGYKIMSIVQLSKQLRVEKRRVYDVINVVICLHMAFKVCKDRYQWHGNQHLAQALSLLKMYALYRHLDSQVIALSNRLNDEQPNDEPIPFEEKSFFEDNRIGALCQKFMMLMLVTKEGECLSLPLASKLILTSDIQFKTGMRRLYDIANALAALGLIVKSPRKDAGKPYFTYSGPKIEVNAVLNPDFSYQRFNYDTDTSESSLDSAVSQISSSSDISGRFVKITPKTNPFVHARGSSPATSEPPAKKRLAFPVRLCREDVENPVIDNNNGIRKSITYIRSPFALKGYVSTKPASLVESERKKVYTEKIRIQPCQPVEPSVTVVDNATNAIISPGLQDGGIYKAYKVGDTFQLVKL